MRHTWYLLLVGMAMCVSARAATFVVAPGGKDADPGTKEQPLATLQAARDAGWPR